MYPAAFEYHAPTSVKEALGLLGKHKDDAKLLAGGHSLIPMMKLRLAQPKHLIDLRKVPGLTGIKQDGNMLAIGAMTTHWEVESSALVKAKLAVLSEVARECLDAPGCSHRRREDSSVSDLPATTRRRHRAVDCRKERAAPLARERALSTR